MAKQQQFNKKELIDCGYGRLFGKNNAQLPVDKMLMLDRIIKIDENNGEFGQGMIHAELDIHPDLWFFDCHFPNDPVMPGCFGLDAMWQLLGFYLGWTEHKGRGRALGVGNVKFFGQVLPTAKKVSYFIDIKRIISRKLVLGIANGCLEVDGREIYIANDLRVGLFTSTDSF